VISNKITTPVSPSTNPAPGVSNTKSSNDDIFKKLLDQTTADQTAAPQEAKAAVKVPVDAKIASEQLKFSGHAIDRMKSRGISFAPDELKSIQDAVARAAGKGSKDTLVLSGDSALIVSVKNNTVVTVMDKALMKDNVFTNIDSTIVL
jgi:flagellar operon protein